MQLLTKIRILLFPAVFVALLSTSSVAMEQNEADHQALREMRAIYENAINSGNLKPLEPLFGAKASGVMITGDVINSFPELEKYNQDVMAYLGEGAKHQIALKPELSDIYGDIALARGTSDESVTMHGKDYNFQSQWTAVLHKEDGQWKCVRLHISLNPFNNVFIDAKVNAAKLTSLGWGGGLGLLVGLISGLGLGRLGRKSA